MDDKAAEIRRQYEMFGILRNDRMEEDLDYITMNELRDRIRNLKDGEILSVQLEEGKEHEPWMTGK